MFLSTVADTEVLHRMSPLAKNLGFAFPFSSLP